MLMHHHRLLLDGAVIPVPLYVDGARANDSGDGATWATAKKYLSSAIKMAEDDPAKHPIVYVKGDGQTYYPDDGTHAYQYATADDRAYSFKIPQDVRIIGSYTTTRPVCSGDLGRDGSDGNRAYSVFRCASTYADSYAEGLVIEGGYGNHSTYKYGGGCYRGEYRDCIIRDNTADRGGAGYAATLRDCVVRDNTATGGYGGGCYSCTVWHTHIRDNYASGYGGGMYSGSAYNCLFTGNYGNRGGCTFYSTTRNCTCYDCPNSKASVHFAGSHYNDITWGAGSTPNYSYSVGGCRLYNCWCPSQHTGRCTYTDCIIGGDPGMTDPANGDYTLESDSVCVDAGNDSYASSISEDWGGDPRIVDTVDIGIYEHQGE